ncbi:hypothetical protein B0H34DRAFT_795571 [Crassisporium funariophilum]|nr:hypothetical protein B0H34DRAFT_795571 [Crassisporium funariophilum]
MTMTDSTPPQPASVSNPFEPPAGPPPSQTPPAAAAAGAPATSTPYSQSPVTTSPTLVAPQLQTPPTTTPPAASATPPAQPQPAQPAAAAVRDAPVDPRVSALRGMFPDYDDLILMSVLESVGGNQDLAIDALLGMSDPDYQSDPTPQAASPQPELSQTDLDEQFARRLMLEEQQQQQQQWVDANANAGQRPPTVYQSQPPRAGWNPQGQNSPQAGSGGGTERPSEFQEQFNKIAETGKKTFGSIFSKVKAKIQELDQGRTPGQPGQSSSSQPTWGAPPTASGPAAYYGQAQPQAQPQPQHQPAYYDPNSHSHSSSPPQQYTAPMARTTTPAATGGLAGAGGAGGAPVVQGYEVTPSPSVSPPPSTQPAGLTTSSSPPRPPTTGSGPPIDAGKLGLLPKRPVSLLRDPASASASLTPSGTGNPPGLSAMGMGTGSPPPAALPTRKATEDEDGLEYAENPFEEAVVKK